MPIVAQCDSCSARVKVRDELAGKRVKCPKCSQAFLIPEAGTKRASTRVATSKSAVKKASPGKTDEYSLSPAYNPMLDLLDEAGVESAPQGPICNNCGTDLPPLAIICVECGFNNETGKQLETTTYKENAEAGMTDGEKLLAKAEKEIDDMPVSANQQDFGDGADSMLIALIAVIGALILVGIGVGTIFVMDKIGENIDTALISFFGSLGIYLFCAIWITVIAFRAKPVHGLACLLTAGLYCVVFGFMQGKALLMPTLICVFAILIGGISWLFAATQESAMLIEAIQIVTIV